MQELLRSKKRKVTSPWCLELFNPKI
jgi:hypothetical protein